jgi:hypothetical protein
MNEIYKITKKTFINMFTINHSTHVVWVPCHHGMARPLVADGGSGFHVWNVATNLLNKHSRVADKKWSSRLKVRRGANNF